MTRKVLLVILIVVCLIVLIFVGGSCLTLAALLSGERTMIGRGDVAVVTIDGGIFSADETIEALTAARDEKSIRAILLRLDSPGGAVAASQEILEAVQQTAAIKPVVASMGSIAASGAYYIALGATKIVANPGTITGSIGVRMEHVEVGELLHWARIHHETLKSGELKDLAPIDRPMRPEERRVLDGLLADLHRQFKETVVAARHLDPAVVDRLADGRIYSGRDAKELGLVDELGGFSTALKMAGQLGKIKGEPKPVKVKKRKFDWLADVLGSAKVLFQADHSPFLYMTPTTF